MTLEAVVFDFDGLIIDSEWVIYESAVAAFAVHGHDLTVEAWATIVGLGDGDDELAWSTLMGAMEIEGFELATFSATYEEQDRANRDSLPLLPGVEVLVDSLVAAGVPIGVASSSSLEWLDRHLMGPLVDWNRRAPGSRRFPWRRRRAAPHNGVPDHHLRGRPLE